MAITKVSAALVDLDGGVVINESSADVDFRVESNGNANAIFVNGGDDRVTFFNGTTINGASGTDDGVSHYSDGRTDISRASGQALNLRRRTDDGVVVNFYKEASGTVTNVGAISVQSSDLVIHSNTSGHVGLQFGNTRLHPTDNAGSTTDGVADLGFSNTRWKDLYISGGAYLGGTAAANALDDYEEGIFTATLADSGGGATYTLNSSFNQLSYTKVGRLVTIHGTLVVSGVSGTPNGSLNVSNLPFTSANLTDQSGKSGGLGVGYYQVQKYTSGVFPQSSLGEGSTALYLFYGVVDANTYSTYANNATQLYFDFTYPAA